MKRRVRKIVNFFAFNLLFFALYLNFVRKENMTLSVTDNTQQTQPAAFSGTVPVENPERYLGKKLNPESREQSREFATASPAIQ